MNILGIDIGGSGIKGAPVDVTSGTLTADRLYMPTPQPAKPDAVANAVAEMVNHFNWSGPIGCGLPSAVQNGIAKTAANIDPAWMGIDTQKLLSQASGCPTTVINDADAAGIAEMHYGAGREKLGTVIMITIGTGLGTALFLDGKLLPNSEHGHLLLSNGKVAEQYASAAARNRSKLSYRHWAKRLDEYLHCMRDLFWPDLFIIGGGISAEHEKFFPYLTIETEVLPAVLRNDAGIVGAAENAHQLARPCL